jgi:hypothetical protein
MENENVKLAFTDEFNKLIRRSKKKYGIDEGFFKALEEAGKQHIFPFRERKKKEFRFRKQQSSFIIDDFSFL